MFFVLWKVSYNYLVDVKGIVEAPRIIKLQKIQEKFWPSNLGEDYRAGVGRGTLSQQKFGADPNTFNQRFDRGDIQGAAFGSANY